ncbi:hypothetical protein BJX61DRAFT_511550 [Aspergillus egyptiacus]|nr:hypothetical protein BJX61DRAFT_511550 [Aspergillus egyptiacus]
MSQVVLITGANRGIGKGLVAHYLARPNTTVIGTVRDVSAQQSQALQSTLQKGPDSRLILVALSASSASSAAAAASTIQTQHGITSIDVVIANAGICNHWGPVREMADTDALAHFDVNTLGPLRLFQAMEPLLLNAAAPKFVLISSLLASIQEIEKMPTTLTAAYGMSKAAGNYMVRKIDAESEQLVAVAIDPGLVQTDMGNRAAGLIGIETAPLTVEDTVLGITKQIDAATKSTTSGQFVNFNGDRIPW